MGETSHEQIVGRLKEADKVYRKVLADIAHEYWRDVLVPMCHKTGFSFLVCNGDYWFVNGEREVRDNWDADKQEAPFLKEYMATLDLPDGLRGIFAHHLEDVRVPVPIAEARLLRKPVPVEVEVLDSPKSIDRAVSKSLKRKGKKKL